MKPNISIVMPTFNNQVYLASAMESVLEQSYKDWEFIIINDGSNDNSDEIIKKYKKKDTRIKYIKNTQNLGMTKSLNIGIELSRGKYIARIDGDDIWTDKNKLKKQIYFMNKNPQCGILGSFANAIDESNNKLFEITYPVSDLDIRKLIMRHGCFIHSSILIRKDTLNKINNYNELRYYSQDYELYLSLGEVGKFHNFPNFMVSYRINPNGMSGTQYGNQMDEVIQILKAHKNSYSGYYVGYLMWKFRKYYPFWFKGALSRQIKKTIPLLNRL